MALCFLGLITCAPNQTETSIEQRIDVLLSQMTLEEKIGQMNQYSGFWDATAH